MELSLAGPVRIDRKSDIGGKRHLARLMGNVGQRYPILDRVDDMEFAADEILTVRLMLDDTAIGFSSMVRDGIGGPVRMVPIDYPTAAEPPDPCPL